MPVTKSYFAFRTYFSLIFSKSSSLLRFSNSFYVFFIINPNYIITDKDIGHQHKKQIIIHKNGQQLDFSSKSVQKFYIFTANIYPYIITLIASNGAVNAVNNMLCTLAITQGSRKHYCSLRWHHRRRIVPSVEWHGLPHHK